ncbi:MAG: bifunctional phosphoribosylaminoimidazolecarboxamide formyltransferase/IMP cyclohydrolase, partial [Akkermansia sp.]|nr:bifunctional phosphoribosylaminoimidazolecarboxamide formyltransferase/IMP cyclohydrolase [Akkermansia sp.]
SYDNAISNYLGHRAEESTKNNFCLSLPFNQTLRYGDNPHQPSVLYGNFDSIFTQLQGKELSYTNILDLDAAASLIMNFRRPTVGILKHTNPCGVGQDDEDLVEAWKRAYQTDTQAPFGGVIVMNRPMTEALARIVGAIFTDVIIAPDYEPEARAILQKKKNCRIMRIDMEAWHEFCKQPMIRTAPGGIMTMKRDDDVMGLDNLEAKVVTKRVPTAEELEAMRFAWRVCKQVHSNAIVFTDKNGTLGIGAGQMSRVDSAKIAVWKAGQAGLDLKGSVIASDGLFPFADGLQTAIDAGATACIQPGGSIRDQEVIDAADAAGIAMVFTGARHFLH